MVLVTGKSGFIGRHVDGNPFTKDIRDITAADLAGVDVVVHLAALKDVEEAQSDPLTYWDVNFFGTHRLVRAMLEANVNKIVFASSAAAYGDSVYGRTKRACEWLLGSLPVKAAILRIFNVIGPGCGGLYRAISTGKVTVFGSDYPTRDGTCERDYVHVSDVAEAIEKSVGYLRSPYGHTFIADIGTGIGTTVIEAANGCELQFGPRRSGDIPISIADPAKAERILGWEAREDRCLSR